MKKLLSVAMLAMVTNFNKVVDSRIKPKKEKTMADIDYIHEAELKCERKNAKRLRENKPCISICQ